MADIVLLIENGAGIRSPSPTAAGSTPGKNPIMKRLRHSGSREEMVGEVDMGTYYEAASETEDHRAQ